MCLIRVILSLYLVTCSYSLLDRQTRLSDVLRDYLTALGDKLEVTSSKRDPDLHSGRKSQNSAVTWLQNTNEKLREWENKQSEAVWDFETNVTSENQKKVADVDVEMSKFYQRLLHEAKSINPDLLDEIHKRQLRLLQQYGSSQDPKIVEETSKTNSDMMIIYNTGKLCREKDPHKCLSLEPGLQNIMASSRDPAELLWAWKGWRDITGPKIRPLYEKYVKLLNQGAVENKYADYGDFWREELFDETPDLEEMCDRLWLEVKPLYVQLHAYVRKKLKEKYGPTIMGTSGTIPAHLLGNMWGQEWANIFDIVTPSSDRQRMKDRDDHLLKELRRKYDVMGLFRLAEEFFSSISMFNMTDTFWKKSMLEKPKDRQVQCHASAHDMYKKNDFRIKMCTEIDVNYLGTIHHEMGHVEYFMAYANQPTVFRESPNSAFHEASGDTMALSVLSDKHLETLGLLNAKRDKLQNDDAIKLLQTALFKIAFLPFGFLIDKWRWKVFSGDIKSSEYNKRFWEMRLQYQGLVAPVPRSEEDFDPAAKFHIPSNSPYMSYFISFLAQFQFYEALCEASGHVGPLHQCDFYKSTKAGHQFKSMLKLGKSVAWKQALFELTGSREISASSIKRYFEPLSKWLTEQLQGETLGWEQGKINWKN